MKTDVVLDDVMYAVLLAAGKHTEQFTRSPARIHEFFKRAQDDPASHGVLRDLRFDTNGVHAYSKDLQEILSRFQLTGVLASPNPMLQTYIIRIRDEAEVTKAVQALGEDVTSAIEHIAKCLARELSPGSGGTGDRAERSDGFQDRG